MLAEGRKGNLWLLVGPLLLLALVSMSVGNMPARRRSPGRCTRPYRDSRATPFFQPCSGTCGCLGWGVRS
ncbi:hypothetical protein SAMN05216459_106283 [Ensifer sp. OV372]|nr:hypothetical protein SAMN05216459_106283 [Ensifer sp. OV372]